VQNATRVARIGCIGAQIGDHVCETEHVRIEIETDDRILVVPPRLAGLSGTA
jgi:hypothetical protein